MKKTVFFLIFIILVSGVFSQSAGQLDKILNFDYDLPDLSNLDQAVLESFIGKFFIIYGSVTETAVINTDEQNFLASVSIIRGVWEKIDKLESYKAELVFSGPEYFSLIPARPPRTVTPEMIVPNVNLTVLCQLTGLKTEEGRAVPVFNVHKIRYGN